MRRRAHPTGFGKSFDAFLSIVTKNGLGMLILIAMASTFTNETVLSEARFKPVRIAPPTRPLLQGDDRMLKLPRMKLAMGTPLIKRAQPGAKVVAFECRGERVFPSHFSEILPLADNEFFPKVKTGDNMTALAQKFTAQRYDNEWYNFEFKAKCGEPPFPDDPAVYCVPKAKTQGEGLADAIKLNSLFRSKLPTITKEKDVVSLRVWPDSFLFFRELRDWLQAEGYLIQWIPVETPLFLLPLERYGQGGAVDIDT